MIDYTRGPARETIARSTAQALEAARALVHDDRRVRSFFFDGRFLTAKDLTREQVYFLTRQADLSRAGGTGVVRGLRVRASADRTTLSVSEGHGLTPGGELVVVPRALSSIRLDDVPEIQRLDATFGLSPIPRELARARTGLYVLALRPVEYTANPIASYPTSVGAARTSHDGDIVEAVALTLIPYPDPIGGGTFELRRSKVALEVFAGAGLRALPVDALPLAMLAIDTGTIRWLDEWMVRREVGSEQSSIVGFGLARRELREAYVQQYDRQLVDVLHARRAAGQGERLLASDAFFALPPVGRIPTAAFDPASLVEFFFPPEVDVQLSVVAEDELGAILDDCLQLPPIDLTLPPDALESISVAILVPVPRGQLERRLQQLSSRLRTGMLPLRAAAVGAVARRLPGDLLLDLQKKWLGAPEAPAPPKGLVDATWGELLAGTATVWYVRRPNVPLRPQTVGAAVREPDDADGPDAGLVKMLRDADLYDEFSALPERASTIALGEIYPLLKSLAAPTSRWRFAAIAADLLRLAQIRHEEYVAVTHRYTQEVQDGLARLDASPLLADVALEAIAAGTRMPSLGRYVNGLDLTRLTEFVNRLAASLREGRTLDQAYLQLSGSPT